MCTQSPNPQSGYWVSVWMNTHLGSAHSPSLGCDAWQAMTACSFYCFQVNAFIVRKGNPGLRTTKIENKIALRCVQVSALGFYCQ